MCFWTTAGLGAGPPAYLFSALYTWARSFGLVVTPEVHAASWKLWLLWFIILVVAN